jgi:hypothetical protein
VEAKKGPAVRVVDKRRTSATLESETRRAIPPDRRDHAILLGYVESFERAEKVRNGPGEAIELPHDNRIKPTPMRVGHEFVQLRAFLFRAGNPQVYELGRDCPAAAIAILAQLVQLHLGRLTVTNR